MGIIYILNFFQIVDFFLCGGFKCLCWETEWAGFVMGSPLGAVPSLRIFATIEGCLSTGICEGGCSGVIFYYRPVTHVGV